MKAILKIEEVAMTIGSFYLLSFCPLGLNVWLWCILFFVPDIGIIGYALNARFGAVLYNLTHHKGVAIAIAIIGFLSSIDFLLATGLLMFAHASFDRILGFGLKYESGFKDTHLGSLQRQRKEVRAI